MADKEAQELLDTARLLRDDANKTGFDFINSELDMSRTFAKRAWSLSATGHLAAAKVQGIAAITAVLPSSIVARPPEPFARQLH